MQRKNGDRQKQLLGRAGWGLLVLFFLAIIEFWILSNAGMNNDILYSWNGKFFIYWFIVLIIPVVIISMVIGKRTKNSNHLWFRAASIAPLVTAIFSLFVFLLSIIGFASSDHGTYQMHFWRPVLFLIFTIFFGLILGIIGSFSYWHIARKK